MPMYGRTRFFSSSFTYFNISLVILNFLLLPANLGFLVSFLKNLHHLVGIF